MNEQKPQPWHEADENPQDKARSKGAPIGTHSLTGGGAAVGMPTAGKEDVERGDHREGPPGAEEPDVMLEPRAQTGDMLGTRKG
jgi:hypothetical protein